MDRHRDVEARNREVQEELFQQEEEEIARLPEGEERRMRQERLAEIRALARAAEDVPDLATSSDSSEDQNHIEALRRRQQEIRDALMARLIHEQINQPDDPRHQTESSTPVGNGASNQELSEIELLAPWLREMKTRSDRLVAELTNMVNALYHTPIRNSAPEMGTLPLAGRRAIRGRSSTGEPVFEPAGRDVPRNAFYWDIRERMTTILARAMQLRNSVPIAGNAESQALPTPESPRLVVFPGQASSFDYPSSLEGAIGSTPSQVQTPEDYDSITFGESASGYTETDSFPSDVQTWSQNPNRRSRTSEERRDAFRQRDPFVSRSPPPPKNSRSKVPTPLDKSDKKPSEKDSHKKTSKKTKVNKQTEKEAQKTPVKKSPKSGSTKSSEKESSAKNKGNKKRKEETFQRQRTSAVCGARPKTTASSVWNETAAPVVWEASSSNPALDVRMPIEESPSPSTGHTSVAHSPVPQSTLENIDCAAVDNSLPTVNQPVDEFSGTYSSGQFTLHSQPVRERTSRVRHVSQAHNPGLGTRALKLTSSPQSPSVNRPLGAEVSDGGASGSNEASTIDVAMSALKLESPASSPREKRPSSRGISALNEARERRIANVRSPSHPDLDAKESPSQTQRVGHKSSRRLKVASDEASRNKSTKFTASSTGSISASVSKAAASVSKAAASVSKAAKSVSKAAASVSKAAASTSVPKGAASVPKGASSTNMSKETSARASKTASVSRVPSDRKMGSKDGFRSISSKQRPGIPTKETGTSTGAPQRSTIRGTEDASSTPSSRVDNVQKRVGGGISRATKELPFSLTKKTSCIQSPREINTSRKTASKMASVRIKTSSAQSSDATDSGKETVASGPFAESADAVPQETSSSHPLGATASEQETCVPFAEYADAAPQETSSSHPLGTTASEQETCVPFAESADAAPQETFFSKSLEATASEKETSASGQFTESTRIVRQETSTQSSMVTESNNEISVAEGASGVDVSNVEDSLAVHGASIENELQKVLEILEPYQMGENSEPTEQTNPVSRKSEPPLRRKATENSPRKYYSV